MKPKKTKKTVTLLTKIEGLLSDVIDECTDIEKSVEKNVREVLLAARSSIVSAIDFISAAMPSETKPKSAAKPAAGAKKRPAARHAAAVHAKVVPVARRAVRK